MRTIAALCVSGRSIYKHTAGVVAYDKARDARTFPGGMPVVAHPPCRFWSKFLGAQARSAADVATIDAEKALGLWCVDQVTRCGGVLEHPAHSELWSAAKLPLPNSPDAHDFFYSLYIEQSWFGFLSRKPTWLLVCGVPRHQLPPLPFRFANSSGPRFGIRRQSQFTRARTVEPFAQWLCQVARLTWWSIPDRHTLPKAAPWMPIRRTEQPGQNPFSPHVRTADTPIKAPVMSTAGPSLP